MTCQTIDHNTQYNSVSSLFYSILSVGGDVLQKTFLIKWFINSLNRPFPTDLDVYTTRLLRMNRCHLCHLRVTLNYAHYIVDTKFSTLNCANWIVHTKLCTQNHANYVVHAFIYIYIFQILEFFGGGSFINGAYPVSFALLIQLQRVLFFNAWI